ncbi:MAG: hypothetical protein RDU14_07725 [Melioribacteraceae bacterium]|nr:hypothetical protein [Melioribacteraceae bacterium]
MSQKRNKIEFESFYNNLLCELAKHASIFTKKRNKQNRIRIEDRRIFVATKKSGEDYKEIPIEFIQTTFESLLEKNEVSQTYLSKNLYVKRSAFIISAFSLLDEYIEYDENNNSIKIVSN